MSLSEDDKRLLTKTEQQAQKILNDNILTVRYNGNTYQRTVPSKQYYTHQWNWDSATVAMGMIHYRPEAAYGELRSLISGQWENGLISHVTYNKDERLYYPQAEKWRTEKHWQHQVPTSGITQPPLLAISVDYIYHHSPDKAQAESFLVDMLPALVKFHDYLKTYRDPEDCGLLTIIHSWESGVDNAPRWDHVYDHYSLDDIPQSVKDDVNENRVDDQLGETSQRPTRANYYRFMGLIDLYAQWDWDSKKIVAQSPFAVKDILFSSIWARANESLAKLMEETGNHEDAKMYRTWAAQTRKAIAGRWDETTKTYTDLDVSQGRNTPIHESTIATFVPLWAGAVTDEQLQKLLHLMTDPERFWTAYPIPSTALDNPKFEIARYWRGPTWPVTNFFVIEGLLRYADKSEQAKKLAQTLIDKTLEMIIEHGFYEYYDPTNGKGEKFGMKKTGEQHFGFADFSWSAAVFISLYERYRKS